VFERFTEDATAAIRGVGLAARAFGHDQIGTEHVVLAILQRGTDLDVSVEAAADWVRQARPAGTAARASFTPHARQGLERTLRQSLAEGSARIEPRHLLIGALGVPDAGGARMLASLGVDVPALLTRLGEVPEQPLAVPTLGDPPALPGALDHVLFYCGLTAVYAVLCVPIALFCDVPALVVSAAVVLPALFMLLSLVFRSVQVRQARARIGGVPLPSEDLRRSLRIRRLDVYGGANRDRAFSFGRRAVVGLTASTLRLPGLAAFVAAHEAAHVARRDSSRIRATLAIAEGLLVSAVLSGTLWTIGYAFVAGLLVMTGNRWLCELGSDAIAVRWAGREPADLFLSLARPSRARRGRRLRWRTSWLHHPPGVVRARRIASVR
jgi:Zn-dependent protease with chaperone function